MLYHIVLPQDWDQYKDQDHYYSATFEQEGFIHLSESHQVEGVLSRYYAGVPEVLKLHIDETLLHTPVVYEPAPNQELFPHLYAPINKSAVIDISTIR